MIPVRCNNVVRAGVASAQARPPRVNLYIRQQQGVSVAVDRPFDHLEHRLNQAAGIRSARSAYVAAVRTRQFQEQLLDAEMQKLSVGASTNFMIVQDEGYLAQARSTEVVARSTYIKSRVSLERAIGTLLESHNIKPVQQYAEPSNSRAAAARIAPPGGHRRGGDLLPEYGIAGAEDRPGIADSRDPATGIGIFSLYGKVTCPTPEMLRGIDARPSTSRAPACAATPSRPPWRTAWKPRSTNESVITGRYCYVLGKDERNEDHQRSSDPGVVKPPQAGGRRRPIVVAAAGAGRDTSGPP